MWTAIIGWIRRRQLAAYFIGAYAVTWILVSPLVTAALGWTGATVPASWHALGALGPITSAFVVTAIVGGRRGLAQLLRGMGRWRIGFGWAAIAVFSPFALFLLSAAILTLFGQPWPDFGGIAAKFTDFSWLSVWFLGSAIYGLGEEPGWRGFALPRLQRRWSALVASVILAIFWGLWHAPFFFYRFQFGSGEVVGFFLGLLAGAIWLTCLYNATGGSILATMSWHITWNMATILAMLVSSTLVSMLSAEVMIAAVVIVFVWKPGSLAPHEKHVASMAEMTTLPRTAPLVHRELVS